jgi:hypothetical protein
MNIIYPMGLMAIFTLLYSVVVVLGRVKAMKKGHVSPKYFKEHVDDTPPATCGKPPGNGAIFMRFRCYSMRPVR